MAQNQSGSTTNPKHLAAKGEHVLSSLPDAAKVGFSVFPCEPGSDRPLKPNGVREATVLEGEIKRWWGETPDANIGVATEDWCILDTRERHVLQLIQDRQADVAKWAAVATPSGSTQYWLPRPETGFNFTDGGYVLAPPSRINGQSLQWVADKFWCNIPLTMPYWLIERVSGSPSDKIKSNVDHKPLTLQPDPTRIAVELKRQHRWLLWKWYVRQNKKGGRWSKRPFMPNGQWGKSNDPATWSSYKDVIAAYETSEFDGIGIVLPDDVVGLDLGSVPKLHFHDFL